MTGDEPGSLQTAEQSESGKRGAGRRRLRYLALIVSLGLFGGVIWAIGPGAVVAATREAEPGWMVAAVGLYGFSLLLRIGKWRLLVAQLEGAADELYLKEKSIEFDPEKPAGSWRVGRVKLAQIFLAGGFLDATTPGARIGGEPLKAYYLSRALGRPKSECLATVIVEKATNLAVLGAIALVALTFVLAAVELKAKLWVTLAGLLALLATGYLLAIGAWLHHRKHRGEDGAGSEWAGRASLPGWLRRVLHRLWGWGPAHRRLAARHDSVEALEGYVSSRLDSFVGSLRLLGRRRGVIGVNVALAALMWAAVFGRTYLLFVAFDSDIYYSEVAVIVTISVLLSYLAFTPGGLGVSEVVLLTLYMAFGVTADIAAAVAVVDRLIYYGFGIGLGYWALRRLEKGPQGAFPEADSR